MALSKMSNDEILKMKTKSGIRFGKELREKEFLFDKEWLNLNHGSFGTYPRTVRTAMRSFQDSVEARPDDWIRHQYSKHLDASREAVAKILKAHYSDLVFVSNATVAINTVFRNLSYQPGDYILYFGTIYSGCEKMIAYLTETTPVQGIKISYTHPVEDDWLVSEFCKTVQSVKEKGGRVKIAIFDTINSVPGARMPFEQLTAACKELGVLSYIDGAHGVGQIDLNLGTLDPDFFASNCHKWFHVPRGCAIMYIPKRNQGLIRTTLATSHGFEPLNLKIGSPWPRGEFVEGGRSQFSVNFEFVGTLDDAPYLCIPTAIKWRETLGGEEAIMAYNIALAQEAAKYLAKELGTEVLDNKTHTMMQCAMSNVCLPISIEKVYAAAEKCGVPKDDVGVEVRDWFHRVANDEFHSFMQLFFAAGSCSWWIRLSGQVYLELNDFEWAAGVLQKICKRVEEGEWAAMKSKL